MRKTLNKTSMKCKPTCMCIRHISLLIFLFAISQTPYAWAESNTQQITVYNRSFSPSIQNLLKLTIERSLELTETEYGPITLNYFKQPSTGNQVHEHVVQGQALQVYFSAHQKIYNDDARIYNLDIPYLTSLLGLRFLTVHKDNTNQFESISDLNDLQEFTVGLGLHWADRKVYEHYQLKYDEAILPKKLIDMLEAKRFDYLSESILDEGLREKGENSKTLSNFFMYYPIPLQMHINAQESDLVERLKLGLERYISTGEPQAYIKQHFLSKLDYQPDTKKKLLLIYNPSYSEEQNQKISQDFLALFEEDMFTILFSREN